MPREVRDPIHGFIERREKEQRLIDAPVFQRLRGIKQLAMAHLVYPGAMHTRFDHSLGVMHVAGRLGQKLLDDDEDEITLVRLAALLHDIGHGPFSHVSEDILKQYADTGKVGSKELKNIHEQISCRIIQSNPDILGILGKVTCDQIAALIQGIDGETILKGIISGPLDADKQDYLLRDSYFCGVKYGIFDLERLIGTLEVHPADHERTLAASKGGVYAIEQFVIAKYHMATQVYRHKIRLITDGMIVRALELGIEFDKLGWLNKLFRYDGSKAFLANFLQWDDSHLTSEILYHTPATRRVAQLFRMLHTRQLLKTVYSLSLRDLPEPTARDLLSKISHPSNRSFRTHLEAEVSEYLAKTLGHAVPSHHVIIASYDFKSVRESSRNNERSIIVLTDEGPKSFEDESSLFRSIDEKQSAQYLDIYAPVTFPSEREKRKRRQQFSQEVTAILLKETKAFFAGRSIDSKKTKRSRNANLKS